MSSKRALIESSNPRLARIFAELDAITDVTDVDVLIEECRKKSKSMANMTKFAALLQRAQLPKELENLVSALELAETRDAVLGGKLLTSSVTMQVGGLRVDAKLVIEHQPRALITIRFVANGSCFYVAKSSGAPDQSAWPYYVLPITFLAPHTIGAKIADTIGVAVMPYKPSDMPWIKNYGLNDPKDSGALQLGMIMHIIERMFVENGPEYRAVFVPQSIEMDFRSLAERIFSTVYPKRFRFQSSSGLTLNEEREKTCELTLDELATLTSKPAHICV